MKSMNQSTGKPLAEVAFAKSNKWCKCAISILLLLASTAFSVKAQDKKDANKIKDVETFLKAFIKKNKYVGASGPGLTAGKAGDILLELADPEESDFNDLILLRKAQNGDLTKIGENGGLMMTREILGSGFMSAALVDNTLDIGGGLGSNSGYSEFSYTMSKGADGAYYFKDYKMRTRNYKIENFYNRVYISDKQTGKLRFDDVTENKLYSFEPKENPQGPKPNNANASLFSRYAPENYIIENAATGKLNLNGQGKDAVLYLRSTEDGENGMIRVLLGKPGGGYSIFADNDKLVLSKEKPNAYNINIIVNKGYFTLEQREGLNDDDAAFEQRQITFKWNSATQQLNLHRFQVEKFPEYGHTSQGFLYDLSVKDFGVVPFDRMQTAAFLTSRKAKGAQIRYYAPSISKLTGILQTKKEATGNYYVLQADAPFSMATDLDQSDPEMQDHDMVGVKELQIYTTDPNHGLADHVGAHISVFGWLFTSRTAGQKTPVVMEVNSFTLLN